MSLRYFSLRLIPDRLPIFACHRYWWQTLHQWILIFEIRYFLKLQTRSIETCFEAVWSMLSICINTKMEFRKYYFHKLCAWYVDPLHQQNLHLYFFIYVIYPQPMECMESVLNKHTHSDSSVYVHQREYGIKSTLYMVFRYSIWWIRLI